MARNPAVVKATQELEERMAAVRALERAIAEAEAESTSSGVIGTLWSALVGPEEVDEDGGPQVQRVVAMKAQLEVYQASVREAAERLATVRRATEDLASEAVAPPVRVEEQEPVWEAAVQSGPDTVARLQGIEELIPVVERLRRLADKLIVETQCIEQGEELRARAAGRVSVRRRRVFHHTGPSLLAGSQARLTGLWEEWGPLARQGERLAHRLGIKLQLPRSGGAGSVVLEGLVGELEGALGLLRTARQSLLDDAPAGALVGHDHTELLGAWERLLELGDALVEAAVPGARKVALLAPLTAWNQQAKRTAALAEASRVELVPPVNEGGELVTFVQTVRAGMPDWRRQVEALRSAGPPRQPAPVSGRREAHPELGGLVAAWEHLLELGAALDKAAVPGVRKVTLLAPLTAWNQQARRVAELAERCGMPPVPPVNEGGDLFAFVHSVRAGLPVWREEVEVMRVMAEA